MNCRSYFSRRRHPRGHNAAPGRFTAGLIPLGILLLAPAAALPAKAGDAPAWMRALVNVPLPAHDDKTDAVLLYSDEEVVVKSADKIRTHVRAVYKILRPAGRERGTVVIPFDFQTHINDLHGWCIPAQGKDFEVREKDSAEVALPAVPGSELISDLKVKVLRIPAPDPGNLVGWEYEQEDRPFVLQRVWSFQREVPVREAHYSLQLPEGWEYKAWWLNAAETAPTKQANNAWEWTLRDVKALESEESMPPLRGVSGQMILNVLAPAGTAGAQALTDWKAIGNWYGGLQRSRIDPSPAIQQKVAELTAGSGTTLEKMQALAAYVQRQVRYVAIELGIGGWQPHPAPEIFEHRYGDCKDKVTLLRAMLQGVGVESYPVAINTERGAVTPAMPADMHAFNHMIVAIRLPEAISSPALVTVLNPPGLGRLLIFDPTDDLTPLGRLRGDLQANYGLLITGEGGQLLEMPALPPSSSGIRRSAQLALDPHGTLAGQVRDVRVGDAANGLRSALRSAQQAADRIRPVETLLSHAFTTFRLTRASVTNLNVLDQPVEFDYSFVAERYAKTAGNLLLVRPRVLGSKTSDLLETKEPRQQPVVFEGLGEDTDQMEITLPQGFVVDDLPPAVDVDYSFASYHSKTEAGGGVLRYTRTFEIKELSVPLARLNELKTLYRVIAGDERNTAVLKPGP